MAGTTRLFVVVLLLIAVALLAAACGSSTGSETGAATPTLEPVPADVLARQLAGYTGQIGTLQAPGDTLERPLSLAGITQAVSLTGGNPPGEKLHLQEGVCLDERGSSSYKGFSQTRRTAIR